MQLSLLRDDIASLTQIFGPSGHEDLVISEFSTRASKEGFSPVIDRLRNVVVRVRPAQPGWPTVAVTAHLDEDLAFAARNAHTAVEVAHLGDLGLLASLLQSVVADLPRSPGFGRG